MDYGRALFLLLDCWSSKSHLQAALAYSGEKLADTYNNKVYEKEPNRRMNQ